MFTKILIANRGEIAVRIIRACKEMGVSSVAVYSEADRETLHTALADESVCIGPASAADSYLNAERIISAALATGAAAIHPGYGFLSENRDFAELCEKNGIAFIGPSAETMKALSDKAESKALMKRAGLPVIPGTEALSGLPEALQEAERIGYPVMLKARSGGGGRGIRVIRSREELEKAYTTAEAESRAAFGDGALYLEKYIYPARHIEAQILADEEGHVLCLGERDCSVQRNHQKLIEESPSPAVDAAMRERLVELVREAVPKIGYTGAGTLEFLLDSQGNFWFMEMNLRLQVEHGVTEMLTGVDLVKWQIRTAAGIALNQRQEDVILNGSCIECRINARSTGKVTALHVPGGPFVRFDTFLAQGAEITPFYDPLLGKLIVLYDSNQISIEGSTDIAFRENVQERMKAFGFQTITVEDGNNISAIGMAIEAAKAETERPSFITIKTQIGYGCPAKQGKASAHGEPVGEDEAGAALGQQIHGLLHLEFRPGDAEPGAGASENRNGGHDRHRRFGQHPSGKQTGRRETAGTLGPEKRIREDKSLSVRPALSGYAEGKRRHPHPFSLCAIRPDGRRKEGDRPRAGGSGRQTEAVCHRGSRPEMVLGGCKNRGLGCFCILSARPRSGGGALRLPQESAGSESLQPGGTSRIAVPNRFVGVERHSVTNARNCTWTTRPYE